MRGYPTAVRHRRVDRVNGAAVARAYDPLRNVAGGDAVHDLFAVLVGIASEQSGLPAMLDQFAQRAAGLHHVGRQFIHAQISLVADDDAAGRIEHAQTLRHVVERVGKTADLGMHPPARDCAGGDGEQRAGKAGHQVGKQRDRHQGASRSWTTIAAPSCGLVNKMPPAAVVRHERAIRRPIAARQSSRSASQTTRSQRVNAYARLTRQYQNLSHSRHCTRVCCSHGKRRV